MERDREYVCVWVSVRGGRAGEALRTPSWALPPLVLLALPCFCYGRSRVATATGAAGAAAGAAAAERVCFLFSFSNLEMGTSKNEYRGRKGKGLVSGES
jgi:hypothetical protein